MLEPSVTQIAMEGLLSSMNSHVALQYTRSNALFAADFASSRSFSLNLFRTPSLVCSGGSLITDATCVHGSYVNVDVVGLVSERVNTSKAY